MGKKLMFEQLRVGRNRHVLGVLQDLACSVGRDSAVDGALTIITGPDGLEFYRAGVLLDRPKDALVALSVLYARVRDEIDALHVAP